ncbi:hypothetical protein D3P07_03875 [Paenibacillus sp. 1011MAR3C5]|uniref:hypothetical protein n=1 Tax=Paenibacillus sp. 1011MAR3C5 TaxID=1675787 RepID=UPI000E6CB106|nr:hypothetical protein [Paenibacillus sp. 1011MAR3C5]RJE91211.1 hypothetical protein D3P07_03875 [Paenibacillus sp. 1011MAR3C5]
MKILKTLIILSILLSACSKPDPFENSMRKGKDALIAKNYEEAVRMFEIALIESPQEENAKILLNQSQDGLKKVEAARELEKYQEDIKILLAEYEVIYKEFVDYEIDRTKLPPVNFVLGKGKLEEYINDAKLLSNQYGHNKGISELHSLLIQSMESLYEKMDSKSVLRLNSSLARTFLTSYYSEIEEIKKMTVK